MLLDGALLTCPFGFLLLCAILAVTLKSEEIFPFETSVICYQITHNHTQEHNIRYSYF
jgi:hypothetical protein